MTFSLRNILWNKTTEDGIEAEREESLDALQEYTSLDAVEDNDPLSILIAREEEERMGERY